MKTLTIDGEEYQVENEVAELIIQISRERDSLKKDPLMSEEEVFQLIGDIY